MSYPTHYQKLRRYIKSGGTSRTLGFAGSNEDLFRFCNRFRLAKAFARIDAKGYNPTTLSAYSALLKVFLVFSAFELLLKALNMRARSLFATHIKRAAPRSQRSNAFQIPVPSLCL
jgi:hypothetical protein